MRTSCWARRGARGIGASAAINRGVARNPVDHPNGGGAGKSKSGGGWQQLTSPWGLLAKGYRTRNKRKHSNRFIVVRRDGRPMKRKINELITIWDDPLKKARLWTVILMEKIEAAKAAKSKTPIKTWSRRSMITPDFVGLDL